MKTWKLGDLQVGWLGPLKKGTKFFHGQRTLDNHTWLRYGRLLITDCDCFDLGEGPV